MIKKTIEKAINEQINAELYSAYLYMSMAAHFRSINLPGAANWMRVQVQEEMVHATKFYDYVLERGGKVTARINALLDLAIKESDHATAAMLQWFVTEQVEEEANADAVIQKLKLTKGEGSGLFMIDQELAARVFVPPAAAPAN